MAWGINLLRNLVVWQRMFLCLLPNGKIMLFFFKCTARPAHKHDLMSGFCTQCFIMQSNSQIINYCLNYTNKPITVSGYIHESRLELHSQLSHKVPWFDKGSYKCTYCIFKYKKKV